jgi:succinyl-CoA synthetase alpha subunit
MGILISAETRVIVQGITGRQGSYHTGQMLDFGTKVVAGVVPGKGGGVVHDVPVYDTVKEAAKIHQPNASIIFVPAPFALDAVLEAIDSQIKTIVVITEHVPIKDAVFMMAQAAESQSTIIGPNTPGIIVPGECKLGILPPNVFAPGNIGVASRSGTLTYEVAAALSRAGLGQSACFGVGGDPIVGLDFIDALKLFKDDPKTKAVALIGEIGGGMEESTAQFILKEHYPKPVVAYVAGRSAPSEKRMGHAGAIVLGKLGTAQSKIDAFKGANVAVAEKPGDVAALLAKALRFI